MAGAEEIVFEPLPAARSGAARQSMHLDAIGHALPMLREKPDAWARVKTYPRQEKKRATAIATWVNKGKAPQLNGEFAACLRLIKDGRIGLYMRFTGDE
jgi:hypothetical protein